MPQSAKESTPTQVSTPDLLTDWSTFTRLNLSIGSIKSRGYAHNPTYEMTITRRPKRDLGTHTCFPPTLENILREIQRQDGGQGWPAGFEMVIHRHGPASKIWEELAAAGVELHDLRSAENPSGFAIPPPFHPVHVEQILRPHGDRHKRPGKGGRVLMSLSTVRPMRMSDVPPVGR